MYRVFGMLAVIVFVSWLIVKLLRSKKLEKLCNDFDSGQMVDTSTSKDTIKDITQSETGLGKTAVSNKKEANKLEKESEGISEFLDKRGVVKMDKGEGKAGKKEDEGEDS